MQGSNRALRRAKRGKVRQEYWRTAAERMADFARRAKRRTLLGVPDGRMAELADARGLGPRGAILGGSTPLPPTILRLYRATYKVGFGW